MPRLREVLQTRRNRRLPRHSENGDAMNDIFYTLRGLLIGVVIAFHLYLTPSPLFIQGAMVGFFLISGVFFKPRTLYQATRKLIIPMMAVSLVSFWLVPTLAEPGRALEFLRIAILLCLLPTGNFLWFLWVLLILWGVTTMFYNRRVALFGISLAALLLNNLPNPFNYLVWYAPTFLFGVVYSKPIYDVVTNTALKISIPKRLNSWLASVGYNSKWIYLTHLPYSNYVRIAFLNYTGVNVAWPLVFVWLYASDKLIGYYRGVLR